MLKVVMLYKSSAVASSSGFVTVEHHYKQAFPSFLGSVLIE